MTQRKLTRVSIACNYPGTGEFWGRAKAFEFKLPSVEVMLQVNAGAVRLDWTPNVLRFGNAERPKLSVPHFGSAEWVDNWCWNQFLLRETDAKRLLLLLARFQYVSADTVTANSQAGIDRFDRWWNRQQAYGREARQYRLERDLPK